MGEGGGSFYRPSIKDKKPKEKGEQSKSEKEAGDMTAQSVEKAAKVCLVQLLSLGVGGEGGRLIL